MADPQDKLEDGEKERDEERDEELDEEQDEGSNEGSDEELDETLLLGLPPELQERIFDFCDLAVLCQLNKYWYARAMPRLWADIDFVEIHQGGDMADATRRFFATCDNMMDTLPQRWSVISSYVQNLNLGRLHGINIVREWNNSDDYIFFASDQQPGERNVFDIIAQFTNLNTLSLYLKNWWEFHRTDNIPTTAAALTKGSANLKDLTIGGQMPKALLLGLLAHPENIRHLSLINLIECPRQDHGPEAITFLSDINERFTSLRSLHLCKFADVDGRDSYPDIDSDGEDIGNGVSHHAAGMRWQFPRQSELLVLQEWAALLHNTSNTITELTLENRYLSGSRFNFSDILNPDVINSAECGAYSIRESQRHLFPLLSAEWPKLRGLNLIGMGTPEDISEATGHLVPRVEVDVRAASAQLMEGDVTPDQVSTPQEFYDYDW